MWVFLLLGMEAIRTYRSNPHLIIGTHQIPTWTTPLLMILVVAALIPNTSLLGHLCGVAVGYVGTSLPLPISCEHMRLTRASSWPRLRQVCCAAGVGSALDRGAPQPAGPPAALCERRPEDVRPVRGAAVEQPDGRQCTHGADGDDAATGPLEARLDLHRTPAMCICEAIGGVR